MRLESYTLPVPENAGNGVSKSVRDLREKYVQIGGDSFTGTLRIEVSLNGSDFARSGSDISARGIYSIPEPALYLRIVNINLGGATPTAVVNGYNTQTG